MLCQKSYGERYRTAFLPRDKTNTPARWYEQVSNRPSFSKELRSQQRSKCLLLFRKK